MRRRAPADVSPLTPAFTAVNGEPGRIDLPLQQRRVRLRRVDTEPRRKARAEKHDSPATPFRRRHRRETRAGAGSRPHPATAAIAQPITTHRTIIDHMLRCASLTKTYLSGGRRLTVLKDISFTVEPGAFVAIVGPSGSGKTTLLGLLAGLDRPTAGTVHLDGEELGALDEDQRARLRGRKVGFVFQSFQLIPTLTARENVQVPLELRGEPSAERAAELLERVGLGDRGHHYPAQLSGGEQQRVALARAFSTRPKVLLADEPTGNLDARTGATIIDLMSELNRDLGTTLVLVTHDLDLAARGPAHHPSRRRRHRRRQRRVIRFVPRMAAREMRAAPRRLLLLTASVAIGVGALVAVGSFTDNVRDSVRGQARGLLGADFALSGRLPLPPSRRAGDRHAPRPRRSRGARDQLRRHGVRPTHQRHPSGTGRCGGARLSVLW